MGNVTLTDGSKVTIRDGSTLTLKEDSALTIKSIDKVSQIDPVAVHLKEINHIDPLSIDALHIDEVKNIDPLQIDKFNVTNLPMVNVSLQKLPQVDINLKTLPPVSVGLHQNLCIPSSYTLRARLLGIELVRLHLNGHTTILPKERARREQKRSDNKSFPVMSAAGNPAIPSHCDDACSNGYHGRVNAMPAQRHSGPAISSFHAEHHIRRQQATPSQPGNPIDVTSSVFSTPTNSHASSSSQPGTLSFGAPQAAFQIPDQPAQDTLSEHRVMSGD